MKWTKRHAQNAVAAKARRREQAAIPAEQSPRGARPRGRAKWRLQIRDLEHGDTLTLTLHRLPWPARYVATQGGEFSAAQLGRGLATLLTHAA